MNPPSSAPAMPSSMVTMNPPGSRPGVTSFAITPTTRPKSIHDRIPIERPPLLCHDGLQARHQLSEERAADDALMSQEPSLTVEAAAVAGQRAVRADDAVTGDDDRDRVGAVGGPHGTDRRRLADAPRQFAIRNGGAGRDAAQRLPDRLLERRAIEFRGNRIERGEVAAKVPPQRLGDLRQGAPHARFARVPALE